MIFENIILEYGLINIFYLIIVSIFCILLVNYLIKPNFFIPQKKINFVFKLIYLYLIFFLILFILLIPFNIGINLGKEIKKDKTLNIQILFDISLSMTADDIKPSRFIQAKKSLIDLIGNLNGFNISIINFSGIPFTYIPFSNDSNAITNKLESMKLGEFPPTLDFVGTAIGDALLLGINNIAKYGISDNPGILILITDGDSNKGLEPLQVAQLAKNLNIIVFTIGIGVDNYIVGYDHYGTPVKTTINIDLLNEIAKTTGGEFYRILNNQDFEKIFNKIFSIIKSNEEIVFYDNIFRLNYIFIIIITILSIIILCIKLFILKNLVKENLKN